MFHYTAETAAGVQEAVAALEASLKEEQFGVLWQLNLHDKLKEKGFDLGRQYVVLEVCNPAEANRVIGANELAGYFLPCKIVVYESDGKTKIGMPNPTLFMNILEDEALTGIAAEVEARLIGCIDRAANPRHDENR